MMKKQTAVEWLVEQILYEVDKYNDDCTEVVGVEYWNAFRSCTDLSKYVDKAKEMEREQIIEAHGNKQKTKNNPDSIVTYGYTYTGEMYYNETYSK
jgi:hypothetical protein